MSAYKHGAKWFGKSVGRCYIKVFVSFLFLTLLILFVVIYPGIDNTKDVNRIVLTRNRSTLSLKKINNDWFINIYDKWKECDNEKVNSMLKSIKNIHIYGLVGKGSDVLASFGVTKNEGVKVSIYRSGSKWVGVFGKRIKGVNRIFLRLGNKDEIYEADDPGKWVYSGLSYWSSLKVIKNNINPDNLEKIYFSHSGSSYDLVKELDQGGAVHWIIYEGKKRIIPDTKKVDKLILEILNVQGENIYTESALSKLSKIAEIRMEKNNKVMVNLLCFKDSNGYYYLGEKRTEFLFSISQNTYNRIIPRIKDLILYY